MDWQNQPNPCRTFDGAPVLRLPLLAADPAGDHQCLYRHRLEPAERQALASVAGFLELSVALSAWKAMGGSRWSLRINPSSGNLHPTETYLLLPRLDHAAPGLYHYFCFGHALESRLGLPADWWADLEAHLGSTGFLVGLTSIFWRESWKYGMRAFRYCNHDVGHALAALRFAANLFGWGVTLLIETPDREIGRLLGLDRTEWAPQEREHPDLLAWVHPARRAPKRRRLPAGLIEQAVDRPLAGTPNRLSPSAVRWPAIKQAAQATVSRGTPAAAMPAVDLPPAAAAESSLTAAAIIRRRRSATAYDPDGRLPHKTFLALLGRTLPRPAHAPFDVGLGPACIHLALFVHRVENLPQGLYLLVRHPDDLPRLKRDFDPRFEWMPAAEALPLYRLAAGDLRLKAIEMSCHQDIAGRSTFSLGMIARFADTVTADPAGYRRLFWEAGMVGQVLYLEAEAQGVRGTGIGCYFDDEVHRLLGISGDRWQSLYHFTIGRPVEDPRLTTLPPYGHLEEIQKVRG